MSTRALTGSWVGPAIEGTILGLLGGCVLFLTAPIVLHETTETFTLDANEPVPSGSSREHGARESAKALLAFALERARDPTLATSAEDRRLRVDVLRNLRIQLVCAAEQREVASSVCNRIGETAPTRLPALQRLPAAERWTLSPWRLVTYGWPALLLGLGWFVFRTSRKLLAETDAATQPDASIPEAQHWLVPQRQSTIAITQAMPKARSPNPSSLLVKTIIGMPQVARTATAQRFHASTLVSLRADAPPAGAEPVTRTMYAVNQGRWGGDPELLTDLQKSELSELRDYLRRETKRGCRVVRIASSATSRYAKSQVAVQLAGSLAQDARTRVLLMEADLDAPALHHVLDLNVPRGFGLSEQLQRLAGADSDRSVTVMKSPVHMSVFAENKWGNPRLLDSPQFAAVLRQQKNDHDVIVVDGPIIDTWPDADVLSGIVDHIVIVVAAGTSSNDAMKLAESHFRGDQILRILRIGAGADA